MLAAIVSVMLAVAATPTPEPPNPFTLTSPTPAPVALPVIGRTRSRALCTALRRSVLPAIDVATKNDVQFAGARQSFYKYYIQNDEGPGKDFILFKLDQTTIATMQNNLQSYKGLLADPALVVQAYRNPDDIHMLEDLKKKAEVLRAAQDLEINMLNGLMETERMNRYQKPSELEQKMKVALGTDQLDEATGDQKVIEQYYGEFHGVTGLGQMATAKAIDTDLGTIETIHLRAAGALAQAVSAAQQFCH
ncbi:MAG TPA: hypothetical protein VHT05_14870 [Candidatus Elarobacter sp.]|jgi:hypothetical protein|nr:hypothetical protein [Candidatus Elarobacter sp.]